MKYAEKLKDPRWQKKRLEVLEARGWTCQACLSRSQTLHVHHEKYTGEPWECPEKDLFVLCDECHTYIHNSPFKASQIVAIGPEKAQVIRLSLIEALTVAEKYHYPKRRKLSLNENYIRTIAYAIAEALDE